MLRLLTAAVATMLFALIAAVPPASALNLPGLSNDASEYQSAIARKSPAQPNPTARDASLARANGAVQAKNWAVAITGFEEAIAYGDTRTATWLALSEAHASAAKPDLNRALQAAYLGIEAAKTGREQAAALFRTGILLEDRMNRLDQALSAYREAKSYAELPDLNERLAAARRKIGLEIRNTRVDPDTEPPQACVYFSETLSQRRDVRFEDYLKLEPQVPVSVDKRSDTLCLTGFENGTNYTLTVLEGLPGDDALNLKKTQTITLRVGDRHPRIAFRGQAFILPSKGNDGIPVSTVNMDAVKLSIYRINDRNLVHQVNRREIMNGVSSSDADDIANQYGQLVWQGQMAVEYQRNKQMTTVFPLARYLTKTEPGIYIITAEPAEQTPGYDNWSKATQWVIMSDLALTVYRGADGLNLFVRSLETAKPVAGVDLTLLARNNTELAKVTTDAEGHAAIPGTLIRGAGGLAAAAVMAYTAAGDYNLLDLGNSAFDLSDRGVGGRKQPGPLDAFLYTDRGIYRPGETIFLGVLLRDEKVVAARGLPLTVKILRPAGTAFVTEVLRNETEGGYFLPVNLTKTAPLGTWTAQVFADPKGQPIGELPFQVEEFVPERLKVELSTTATVLEANKPAEILSKTRFLYGPPAAGLPGTAELTLEREPKPFPNQPGYYFGLEQETFSSRLTTLPFTDTDDKGESRLNVRLTEPPDTSLPLRARIKVEVAEPGGRATTETITLPVRTRPLAVGIKPLFSDRRAEEGKEAPFEIIAVDAEGKAVAAPGLRYELYREQVDYQWFMRGGSLRYQVIVRDEKKGNGALAVAADKPQRLALQVDWGRYRVEVFDPATGAATSLRFRAGWQLGPQVSDTPDKLEVVADKPAYAPGDTAKIHIQPPFAAEVLVTVASDRIHLHRLASVPADGGTIEIPVGSDWGPGAYVTATAYRPLVKDQPRAPLRAIGVAWLQVDPSLRTLNVAVAIPDRIKPRQRFEVPIKVTATQPITEAYVTLAAVDEGILQLTDFATPKPAAYFFGKRGLAVDIRDDYGRLIETATGPIGVVRQGGDEGGQRGLPVVPTKTVALFQGPVRINPDGEAKIALDIPDFNGELRLMVVAYDHQRVGSGDAHLTVRDDLVAEATLPRFLAPGDDSRMTLSLHNVDGQPGAFKVAVQAEGAVTVEGVPGSVDLTQGQRRSLPLSLRGKTAGIGHIVLKIDGPGGFALTRDWQIAVRPTQPPETVFTTKLVQPGEVIQASATLLSPYVPGSSGMSLTFSASPRFDVAGLLKALDRFPYGCLEQTTSRALPLLQVNDVALALGADRRPDDSLPQRVDEAVSRVLDMQRYNGSFGLWSSRGEAEPWLSAYAMEFLLRAQAKGHAVPEVALRSGLQYLREMVDESSDSPGDLAARSYALHVLSMAGVLTPGPLRYFADTFLGKLPTPLARAQVGSALAKLGDTARAKIAFTEALKNLSRDYWHDDYGTGIRDAAAIIVLMTEAGQLTERLPELVDRLPAKDIEVKMTSTQEQAWLVLAAQKLLRPDKRVSLTVNNQPVAPADPINLIPTGSQLGAGLAIRNAGQQPIWHGATLYGIRSAPQPAQRNGLRISRKFLKRDGTPVNLDAIKQNDVFIVVIDGEAQTKINHQALISHPLPAGWEIDGVKLGPGPVAEFPFLGELSQPLYAERRDDRFVAAIDLNEEEPGFHFAYMVRAVTPGTYELPGASVEDMYKPRFFARQAVGRITVQPAGP